MTTSATGLNSSMKPTMSTTATASRRSRPVRLANKNPAACRFTLPAAGFGVLYSVRLPRGWDGPRLTRQDRKPRRERQKHHDDQRDHQHAERHTRQHVVDVVHTHRHP